MSILTCYVSIQVPRYENAKSEFQVTPTEVYFSVFNDSVIIKVVYVSIQ